MKNENKLIYYGIIFYFLYVHTYNIIGNLLIISVLIMRWNIHFIPLLLLLLIVCLSILFYRAKKFPEIRIWFVITVVFLSIVVKVFNLPERFYLTGGNPYYSTEMQSVILNYILTCGVVNIVVFIAISYFKYLKS